jgi:hypothetical protein
MDFDKFIRNHKARGRFRLVILESPYAATETHTVDDHLAYARACMHDSLERGEAPIASHLLYTQPGVLDDSVPWQRVIGIEAGLAWRYAADLHVFYIDLGWSKGMKQALEAIAGDGVVFGRSSYEVRSIGWKK